LWEIPFQESLFTGMSALTASNACRAKLMPIPIFFAQPETRPAGKERKFSISNEFLEHFQFEILAEQQATLACAHLAAKDLVRSLRENKSLLMKQLLQNWTMDSVT